MADAYIPKNPDDLIRAADWNQIQIDTRHEIQSVHDHTGGDKGLPIGADALAPEAVTLEKLAADVMEKLESIEAIANEALQKVKELEDSIGARSYDVELVEPGPDPSAVLEILVKEAGLDPSEAKDLVDSAPSIVRSGIPLEEAENLMLLLGSVGATVNVKATSDSGSGDALQQAQKAMQAAEEAANAASDAQQVAGQALAQVDAAQQAATAAMTKANSVDSIAKEALTKAKIGLSLDYALHGQAAKDITSP